MTPAPAATSGDASPIVPLPAATVVLLRPGGPGERPEILLTRRPSTMAFAADLHVFPGGRVDRADADPRALRRSALSGEAAAMRLGGGVSPTEALAAHLAAIRELFEEVGVLLADGSAGAADPPADDVRELRARFLAGELTLADLGDELGLRFRTDLLVPIGHWTTPPVMPRRFDTRFFAAELPPGAEPSFDEGEVVDLRWLTAADALEAMGDGSIGMWVPTSATLQQLEHARDLDEVARAIRLGPAMSPPRVVAESDVVTRAVLGGAGAVPGQPVNAYLVGRREIVAVDPGDPSDEAASTLLAAAESRGGRIAAIALTHVDPDHAAGAEGLALRLEVPILTGPGAGAPLPYDVVELADGSRLPAGDISLTVVETPGPRPDHVAYLLREEEPPMVIAGDLVGGRADRAILGPPDEAAWRESLRRLTGHRPGRLLPGHGEPLGPEALGTQDR